MREIVALKLSEYYFFLSHDPIHVSETLKLPFHPKDESSQGEKKGIYNFHREHFNE